MIRLLCVCIFLHPLLSAPALNGMFDFRKGLVEVSHFLGRKMLFLYQQIDLMKRGRPRERSYPGLILQECSSYRCYSSVQYEDFGNHLKLKLFGNES